MPDRTDGVPVREAAHQLGISAQAVRKRARRGSLTAYKSNDIWYIVVPEADNAGHVPGRAAYQPTGTRRDDLATIDEGLVQALREQLEFMQREVEQRDTEIVEMRRTHADQIHELHVMLQTSQRLIPTAVPDTPATPQRAEDVPPAPIPNTAPVVAGREIEASQRAPRRSSWWSRLFGLE